VAWTRAALVLAAIAAVALAVVSGGSGADPRTPAALPGLPPPFLGTAVAGSGGLTVAVDAYGDVVDLRTPGPAGRALIANPSDRQAAGSVPADTGIVPRVRFADGPALPLWRADSVRQSYLPGTDVVRTTARFGLVQVRVRSVALGRVLALDATVAGHMGSDAGAPPRLARASFEVNLIDGSGLRCDQSPGKTAVLVCGPGGEAGSGTGDGALGSTATRLAGRAAAADRAWLARAHPLGRSAPAWAQRMYERSLLTLRALTDRRAGAVAAGARDGWAYVWPRDAGTAALAFAASGYRPEARRVARFLAGLDLSAAARFHGDRSPVPGRAAQGDAAAWVAVAARAAGISPPLQTSAWRNRPDYQEGAPGDYLANAIASTTVDGPKTHAYRGKSAHRPDGIAAEFGTRRGLVRSAGDPESGLDSAAAWAVRPFAHPALFPAVRRSLLHLARRQTPFGITPGQGWTGGTDPWTAPTAWTAWSFAALAREEAGATSSPERPAAAHADRRRALGLLADLRRAETPAGELPERVDAHSGVPRSTTPLAWSHAFAVLALRELWPGR
jgi:hypothetical protein